MDLSNLSKDTLISIILDQLLIIDKYENKRTISPKKCKCRTWSGFPNKQCSHKGTFNGYCKIHNNHRLQWGQWHLGEIEGPIPNYWGELCDYIPSGKIKGTKIIYKNNS